MNINLTIKDIILGGVIILLLFLLKCSGDSINSTKAELYLNEYNLNVMKDSIKNTITSNKELIASKKSLVTKLEDLSLYNDSLGKRVNYLKKELKSRPIVYVNTGLKIIHDTVIVDNYIDKLNDSTYAVIFENDTTYNPGNGRILAGDLKIITKDSIFKVEDFKITKDELFFNAEIVFSEKNDTITASVISEHPGFTADNIKPVVLDPELLPVYKKLNSKRFTIGPYIGIGVGSNLKISPQIGLGVTYKIINF